MPASPLILHVNQHKIRSNQATSSRSPPLIVRRRSRKHPVVHCDNVDIYVDGVKIGSLVYRPDDPLACGARVWLELDSEKVTVVTSNSEIEEKETCPTD